MNDNNRYTRATFFFFWSLRAFRNIHSSSYTTPRLAFSSKLARERKKIYKIKNGEESLSTFRQNTKKKSTKPSARCTINLLSCCLKISRSRWTWISCAFDFWELLRWRWSENESREHTKQTDRLCNLSVLDRRAHWWFNQRTWSDCDW